MSIGIIDGFDWDEFQLKHNATKEMEKKLMSLINGEGDNLELVYQLCSNMKNGWEDYGYDVHLELVKNPILCAKYNLELKQLENIKGLVMHGQRIDSIVEDTLQYIHLFPNIKTLELWGPDLTFENFPRSDGRIKKVDTLEKLILTTLATGFNYQEGKKMKEKIKEMAVEWVPDNCEITAE